MGEFDKHYWEDRWSHAVSAPGRLLSASPYLPAETANLPVGTALDAGCGVGTEALWLAEHGWQVTAADISTTALATARTRAADAGLEAPIEWVEADLARWEPRQRWDLVVTNYAHAHIGQLALYQRLSTWVASGGTLLIVGHLHVGQRGGHGGRDHPDDATATLAEVTNLFRGSEWRIDAGYESVRTAHPGGHAVQLRDVIVRARRLT